jgi:hypothetical protein
MSRFFSKLASSGEDSSSDSEYYSSSDEEEEVTSSEEEEEEEESGSSSDEEDEGEDKPAVGATAARPTGASRFMIGAASDSDSESEDDGRKRVVMSAKDKKVEELRTVAKMIGNGIKCGDWVLIHTGMCLLQRLSHVVRDEDQTKHMHTQNSTSWPACWPSPHSPCPRIASTFASSPAWRSTSPPPWTTRVPSKR